MKKTNNSGFTLIELMIVIAIIGILVSVALPLYGNFTKKAKFTEVTAAAIPAKRAIETCLQSYFSADKCNTWDKIGVVVNQLTQAEMVDSATIDSATASLTIVGHSTELNGATYIITPNFNSATNTITWTYGGTCKTQQTTRYC